MTLREILNSIRSTDGSPYVAAGRTNTLCSIVYYLATDVVWSIAAFSLARICRAKFAIYVALTYLTLTLKVNFRIPGIVGAGVGAGVVALGPVVVCVTLVVVVVVASKTCKQASCESRVRLEHSGVIMPPNS